MKLFLFLLAAAGGVIAWQRRHETPPLPPAEPFMDPAPVAGRPAVRPSPLATPASEADTAELPVVEDTAVAAEPDLAAAVDGGPAEDAGVVAEGNRGGLPTPPHGPFTTAPTGPADDLKKISGIGPKLEQILNQQGITTFAQLAALSDDDVDALQRRLPQFPGRIRRDDWVGQAGRLAGS